MKRLGMDLEFFKDDLEEIQSDSLSDIAVRKARDAFKISHRPVIVEDAGLFVDSLGGFPGPYSSYVFSTIGNGGILDLLDARSSNNNRRARFISIIAYCDGVITTSFCGTLDGTISTSQKGDGWGYDPIFVPCPVDDNGNDGDDDGDDDGEQRPTIAQLAGVKDEISHRYVALEKFSNWWRSRDQNQSSDP